MNVSAVLSQVLVSLLLFIFAQSGTLGQEPKSHWNGYERVGFQVEGRKCWVIKPEESLEGRPWIWRARFFGHEPQADIALLKAGYHLGYCDVAGLFGCPRAVQHWDAFYKVATERFGLSERVALEGMSRGGLIIYNWAAANPEKVACIYGDAPVCDIRSWPKGEWNGKGSEATWKQCLAAYAAAGVAEDDIVGPLDPTQLRKLAKEGIPLLHVVGEADVVVPVAENTYLLAEKYLELGGSIEVIRKPGVGHHPHSLKEPGKIVSFVRKAMEPNIRKRGTLTNSRNTFLSKKKGRVAFIGGSITQMNGYRPMIAADLQKRFPESKFQFVNAGISSTCSTTGAFRMQEHVLEGEPIDLFFVEFAVNDDQDAAHSTQDCIRGLEGILRQALESNPNMDIVVTHFVNTKMLNSFARGETPLSIAAHERVVQHYGVSSIVLAKEISERIEDESMSWKVYGGVHPKPAGNRACADMIHSLLETAWQDGTSEIRAHPVPDDLLDRTSYVGGRMLPQNQANSIQGWQIKVPQWKELTGGKREQFLGLPLLCAEEAGATLEIRFQGSALGAYLLAGPDAGVLEVAIDQGVAQQFELQHRHSRNLHYPRTVMFAADMAAGEHVAKVRLMGAEHGKSAARIIRFVAN